MCKEKEDNILAFQILFQTVFYYQGIRIEEPYRNFYYQGILECVQPLTSGTQYSTLKTIHLRTKCADPFLLKQYNTYEENNEQNSLNLDVIWVQFLFEHC